MAEPRRAGGWWARTASRLMLLAVVSGVAACSTATPAFTDAQGQPIAGSVALEQRVKIGGIEQTLWFRGRSAAHPLLVMLHGGPGASETALFRHYDTDLERDFVVVYWDQRGTGRSLHDDIPKQSMTIAQFERDLDQVVDLVTVRFHQRKVALLGHSWGAVLATLYAAHHPHKVSAFVAVAPLVDKRSQDALSWQFAMQQARQRGDRRAIDALRAIGPQPRNVDDELALGNWVERFGGTFYRNRLSTGKLIWAALQTPEAGLYDLVRFGRGNRFSLHALWPEYSQVDLHGCTRFAMPVFVMLGRHDWHVPSVVAAKWFETIDAPRKRLLWFEESAHNPPFEQPHAFVAAMRDQVLPVAARAAF